jgi:hypothetical protein
MKKINLKYLRMSAMVLGALSSLAGLWFLMHHAVEQPEQSGQFTTIKYLSYFLFFGFVLAWFRPKEGGIVQSFGSLILFMYLVYLPVVNKIWMILFFTGFLLTGLLFIAYNYLLEKKNH